MFQKAAICSGDFPNFFADFLLRDEAGLLLAN
jgi:hypothetical protein